MGTTKRILCLANSRKVSGRCIAGIEFVRRRKLKWIRPISAREHEEVSSYERCYQDGSEPALLDILDVPLLEPRPRDHQCENWLLDPDFYWEKTGTLEVSDLKKFLAPADPLWIDGHSTYSGRNDEIPCDLARELDSSLRLISVDNLKVVVFRPGADFGNTKRRVQGRFVFAGNDYWLWITDPEIERRFLSKPDGSYDVGASYLTISIGEPYNNACYKLIAAVIDSTRRATK